MNPSASRRGWTVESPGFLGWLQAVLVWLALAVAVSAVAIALPGSRLTLPEGFRGAAWGVLVAAGFLWLVRFGSYLLARQVLGSLVCLSGALAHLFLALALAAGRDLGGLLGVFGLFLAAGEILRLIELRGTPPPAWLRRGRPVLQPKARIGLSVGALAAYFLIVFASFR